MGVCCSTADRSPDNYKKDAPQQVNEDEIVRFFMIGMGAAGKSTVIKQLQKLCHIRPEIYQMYNDEWKPIHHIFKDHELQSWTKIIRKNIFEAMFVLLKQSYLWEKELRTQEAELASHSIIQGGDIVDDIEWQRDPEIVEKIIKVFSDSTIQETYDRRAQMNKELQLSDGSIYFLNERKIKEAFSSSYSPSDDDILHARSPTTGITDYRFGIHNMKIMIHDIGGQKVERAKTVNYINNWVSADRSNFRNFILYVVSMAEYNVQHPVHQNMTLLDESLKMLQLVLELQPVQNCGVMIFLNKEDIFKDKIKRCRDIPEVRGETVRHLGKYMQKKDQENLEKHGEFSYNAMRKCVAAKFAHTVSQSKVKRNKGVYHKYTCAVDSKLMDTMFGAIQNEIINARVDSADWIP